VGFAIHFLSMNVAVFDLLTKLGSPLMSALFLCGLLSVSNVSAATCKPIKSLPDEWVRTRVNLFVRAARNLYDDDKNEKSYQKILDDIADTIKQCGLAQDQSFVGRYPEFVDYFSLVSLDRLADHELGFNVPDRQYFAETREYVEIPDFLLTPKFLRAVSRFETLNQAKQLLRELNANRPPAEQLIFFSYSSRHLGTPDNPDSYRRLLIIVPGNAARQIPEKWVQFGVPDPRARASVRNVSVVSVVTTLSGIRNVYFKDYYRTYRRNGLITIKGRWELGYGDDNCAQCHKSGILPIFPVAGSVVRDELPLVDTVNDRFKSYVPASFDKYLDSSKLGPGLGSGSRREIGKGAGTNSGARLTTDAITCAECHQPGRLGALNWPMDRTLISSYVKGGQMPFGYDLDKAQRNELYQKLVRDYFAIDDANPGILKAWLLGRPR